jgi:hypothetical protein
LNSALKLWKREFNLAIETTGSLQSRIKSVRTVSCHKNLDVSARFEAVELVDDLKHRALDFAVALTVSSSTDRIDFIEENDASFLCASQLEQLTYHTSAFTDVALDQLTADDSDEACIRTVCDSSRT